MSDSTLENRKKRWLEFYDLSSPRRVAYIIRYAPDLPPRPLPTPENIPERIQWIWRNYEYHLQRLEWLQDDTVPCLDMLTGTELFAEAFGCRILYPANNNPAPFPLIHNLADAEGLQVPSLDVPAFRRIFEMADLLSRRAGPGALFRLVDMQCPLDVAAMMWDKLDFYPALIRAPGVVAGLLEKIIALQFAFLDEWYRRYGTQFIAHFPEYYMPGGVTLSVDEAGAVSSELFRKFFLPHLKQFSQRYGGLGVHCCANARHQWQNFKELPDIYLLNLVNKPEVIREAYSFFADFVPQWHYDQSPQTLTPQEWMQAIPPSSHIVFDVTADSKDAALRISEELSSLTG
jgi:hypothetical protein